MLNGRYKESKHPSAVWQTILLAEGVPKKVHAFAAFLRRPLCATAGRGSLRTGITTDSASRGVATLPFAGFVRSVVSTPQA
jgi:hypothetical protein